MKLILIRHAKSSHKHDLPDHERPLNKRGKGDAPVIASYMVALGHIPELVICSDARRCLDTWELMADVLKKSGHEPELQENRVLYDVAHQGGAWHDFLNVLRSVPEGVESLALVGHNPTMEDLARSLAGESVTVTTCNVVVLEGEARTWFEFLGRSGVEVLAHLSPREPRS